MPIVRRSLWIVFAFGVVLLLGGVGKLAPWWRAEPLVWRHELPQALQQQLPQALQDSDYLPYDAGRAELGRLLFYDPLLSGNKNIACATCHHHTLASTDHLALGLGEGGQGLGPARRRIDPVTSLVPRNAPALFNLGHVDMVHLFHDGRVSRNPARRWGFDTPAKDKLPLGLSSLTAAQSLFPLTSAIEMAGGPDENELGQAAHWRADLVWQRLVARIRAVPAYEAAFRLAYPDSIKAAKDIEIQHLANALGDFINSEWRADQSKFDAFLRDQQGLTPQEGQGLALFYGDAGCAQCHSGPLLSDQAFHAVAMPQMGPGKADPSKADKDYQDLGRALVTGREQDAYKFRTPMLRNIAYTFPYGHAGSFASLDAVLRHKSDPQASLQAYRATSAAMPSWDNATPAKADAQGQADTAPILAANQLPRLGLSDDDRAALLAFLMTLTDPDSLKGRLGPATRVPSGLPLDAF